MSISKFKIKEGLDLDGLVLTNNEGTLYADGSAVGVTYIDSVSTDFDVTNGLLSVPTNSTIATKSYVDATAQGLDVKQSVQLATTGSITLSGEGLNDDGNSYYSTDRVLVKNQANIIENGIYEVNKNGAWSKTLDGITGNGAFTFVESGPNAGKGFVQLSDGTWSQFSETGNYITSVGTNLLVGDGNGGTTLGELNLGANVLTTDLIGSASAGYQAVSVDFVTGDLVVPETDISGKQDTLTASTGITIDGSNNISVTSGTYEPYGTANALINDSGSSVTQVWSSYKTDTELSGKQNVLTAGNGIDITNDTISLDSDVIVTSVALTDATTGVSAGSDVLGNATNTTYAMGSAQSIYTFASGTKTADIFVQIINAAGDTRTSKITAVFNGGSAPIWTEYGIVDSGTAMATTVSFDSSNVFKINITGSGTYAVHGVTTFLS